MPNLRLFTQAGYPFSRFADLSQTVFVLPREPGASDVATFLTTVARIGRQTGTAGLLLSVTTAPEPEALADRDLLLIGRLPEAYDLETYDAFLGDTILEHLAPTDADAPRHLRQVAVRADLLTSDRRAVLLGFESPLKEGRSVVALLSAPGEGTHILQEKLSTLGSFYDVDGSLSVVAGPSSVNFRSVDTYWIGDLPWHQRLWYALLDRPLVLFGLSILFLGVTAVLLYLLMTRVVARRLLAARDALRIPSNRKS